MSDFSSGVRAEQAFLQACHFLRLNKFKFASSASQFNLHQAFGISLLVLIHNF